MSMKTRISAFFGPSRQYAVAGALNNPAKFGHKVLQWYVAHGLPVVPVNPTATEILGLPVAPSVAPVVEAAAGGGGVSILFLTPPHVTVATLEEIAATPHYREAVRGLWFQPGLYDAAALETAERIGLGDRVVHEDECILVRGEQGMAAANL